MNISLNPISLYCKNNTSQGLTFIHRNIFAEVYDHLLHFCLAKVSLKGKQLKKFDLGPEEKFPVEMSEKLCLQWNDFRESVDSAFKKLRNDKELTDVTLACEDGQQIETHKIILAASSPFFKKILQRSKHPHPLIYLKGFQSKDFASILDLARQMFIKKILIPSLPLLRRFS